MARSADGFMEKYNPHDWNAFEVKKLEDKPKTPHFGVVLFDSRSQYTPAYDERDSPSSHEVPELRYFAFKEKKILEAWLLRANKADKKFFFFEVKKLGEVAIKVVVDVETSL